MKSSLLKFKYCLLIIFSKFIYSLTTIFSKLASKEEFLSKKFCFYCFIIIVILAFYAFLWQQALKKVSLSLAMLFKPIALILSILWAVLLFNEKLSLKIFIGIALIIIGIVIAGDQHE